MALAASSFLASQHAQWLRELAAAPPTGEALAADAVALQAREREVDEWEEDEEWRANEGRLCTLSLEACGGSSYTLSDDLFDGAGMSGAGGA